MMTLLVIFFSIVILLMMSVFLYMITIKRTSAKVMVMDDVRKTISKGSSILDFGAGNGVIRDELVKYGYSVVSIDVEGASSHPQIRTYDGHRIPYEDNTFDACLCIYVLHHIPHHASILYELRRVCRLGATMIIYEDLPPTHTLCKAQMCAHFWWFGQSCDMISTCIRPSSQWRALFSLSGWKIQEEKIVRGSWNYTCSHIQWVLKAV